MADLDVTPEPIYVFRLDHTYVFKHYFELNELFAELRDHYDGNAYRFEVPERVWADVSAILRAYAYEPEVVESVEDFVVVKERYTRHAEILRNSVAHWSRRGFNFFLLKDPSAVERAVADLGATPVTETDLVAGL